MQISDCGFKKEAAAFYSAFSIPQSIPYTLKNPRRAHPAADAHRDHAVASVAPFELAEDGRRQLRAGAAERVSESYRAAVDIDLFRVEAELFDDRERLGRECFVEFYQVYLVERKPGHLQSLRDR